MTKEEMAKSYSDDFDNEIYKEIAYDAFLCGFTAKCESSLPSNLDEAAEKMYPKQYAYMPKPGSTIDLGKALRDAFKAGVKYLAGQGYTKEGIARPDDCEIWVNLTDTDIKDGDKVIVQIRKKWNNLMVSENQKPCISTGQTSTE